ncbi:hypothetical protein [Streptomyces geranii]|uniref:hypothetical protein n=1 Tax=Streptomyces geranii TaxID=2058923 RepID=UPI000D037770|nr:hypothetical protein [Streptomyces geranii]
MYGPGAQPPARSAGTVITLRVLFAAAGFLSCGLLACLPLFRVAILRGRWFDWVAAWVSLPLSIACFAVVGTVEESNAKGDVALAAVMILGALGSAYFLITDIRLAGRPGNQQYGYAGYPQGPTPTPNMPPGYGYPPPSPYANTPPPGMGSPAPHHTPTPQHQHRPPVPGPVPPPPPQRPAPARIDQVRAELDELSDYLRKHDGSNGGSGGANGGHEGGR